LLRIRYSICISRRDKNTKSFKSLSKTDIEPPRGIFKLLTGANSTVKRVNSFKLVGAMFRNSLAEKSQTQKSKTATISPTIAASPRPTTSFPPLLVASLFAPPELSTLPSSTGFGENDIFSGYVLKPSLLSISATFDKAKDFPKFTPEDSKFNDRIIGRPVNLYFVNPVHHTFSKARNMGQGAGLPNTQKINVK
jgi:hypothetical protein